MILIYDNSNPIMGSFLSAASMVAEFNYSQVRFPQLGGPFLPVPEVHPNCLRAFRGLMMVVGVLSGGGERPPCRAPPPAPVCRSDRPRRHSLQLAAAQGRT